MRNWAEVDITKYLKDYPLGIKMYSPELGECELIEFTDRTVTVQYIDKKSNKAKTYTYDQFGRDYQGHYPDKNCHIFLEKEKEWFDFVKPNFEFKPFDKVLVRNRKDGCWQPNFFGKFSKYNPSTPYFCLYGWWTYCIPFNEETEKLLGTKQDYIQ